MTYAQRIAIMVLLLLPVVDSLASAQQDSARHWYDTLTVTKPRYARQSRYDRMILSAFAALSVPVAMTVGTLSLFPPSFSALYEDGTTYGGIAFSTGRSFGIDTTPATYFPDVRVQGEFAYFFSRPHSTVLRASGLFDHRFGPVTRREIFWFGVSGGAGVATDFHGVSPFAEGSIGVMNPLGIRFLGLFPMHNYGVRVRAGFDVTNEQPWYELSLSGTSTF